MSGGPSEEAPRQQTIKTPFTLEGTGLHSGQPAFAEVHPADADTGILFRRSDIRGTPEVKADVELVSGVEWETVLGPDDSCVRTVEHLLAALAAHRIDNAEILLRDPSHQHAMEAAPTGAPRSSEPGSFRSMRKRRS